MRQEYGGLRAGIDIGSTTIKVWLEDASDRLLFSHYVRHHADIGKELERLLGMLVEKAEDRPFVLAFTGSGGMDVASIIGADFVQEVVAGTEAVEHAYPHADVIIELGGEDAKITYLKPHLEQRMNGTCAGGTGSFIDQMASLMQTDAAGLNEMAADHQTLYSIASRCGVFAKSDLQPLINDGASKADLAASVFQAIVNQTIAGLACGRPIKGHVVLLGGPLHFLDQLSYAFERTLQGQVDSFIRPEDAHYVVAKGAARLASGKPQTAAHYLERWQNRSEVRQMTETLPPLFENAEEREQFEKRHAADQIDLYAEGKGTPPYYLGIDAGSTTTKAVLVDSEGKIVFSDYRSNDGQPVEAAKAILYSIYDTFGDDVEIGRATATGYGENLVKTAFRLSDGIVETMAHYRGASEFLPGVSFILDIGGQDMKCLHIRDGIIDSIVVNEACSSGCGSFLQTFAAALDVSVETFAEQAMQAKKPVDLGTRCTVFMNSKVKQAQKQGSSVEDIAAGLSYSVVRNALYKVIKIKDPKQLGDLVVCQGGTFLNDSVLRAFELVANKEVVRPSIAGLMGAFGAALLAKEQAAEAVGQAVLTRAELDQLKQKTTLATCGLCENRCKLTISRFDDRLNVSGNRCERGAGIEKKHTDLPNLIAYKYERTFAYEPRPADEAPLGTIGIPRALNMFENYPFWFTLLDHLGFSVQLSNQTSKELFMLGMDTIPSESVCYPAKLAHGHVEDLIERGIKTIFYPDVVIEEETVPDADQTFNCPIVVSYPEVIRANVERLETHDIDFINPFVGLNDKRHLAKRLLPFFEKFGVTAGQMKEAVLKATKEDERYKEDLFSAGEQALIRMEAEGGQGIVLAGRPYHADPGIHHGIPELINQLGLYVFSEESLLRDRLSERPLRVVDQWAYHSRLYAAASLVSERADLELVQLNSFGCGLDAITTEQVEEILRAHGKVYTCLKIDEVSNLGAARIRLRSLLIAMKERAKSAPTLKTKPYRAKRVEFTKEMKKTHTILAPQMSPIHFRLVETAFQTAGYHMVVLETATAADIETGLRFVNNDACYPTMMVVGQLLNALMSGAYDPENTSVLITQTGGGCRATNYVAFLRKALQDAGLPEIPVIALSANGIETNSGFSYTPSLIHRGIQALVVGDVLQHVLLRVRPYEKEKGAANRLYEKWHKRFNAYFEKASDARPLSAMIKDCVEAFDKLPLVSEPNKPRVGLVGEILVKFHPDANNHVIDFIEEEGYEAAMPGLLDFFLYCFYNQRWKRKALNTSFIGDKLARLAVSVLERYRKVANQALAASTRFSPSERIEKIADRAKDLLSLGNQSGEGWFLTGEMLELIAGGVPNIICAQPFACLPNHVTGKGMIRAIQKRHPEANIVPVDYDPGTSEVNQQNRIKLMLSRAKSTIVPPVQEADREVVRRETRKGHIPLPDVTS